MTFAYFLVAVLLVVLALVWQQMRRLRREAYIRGYHFPTGLHERLHKRRPGLVAKDAELVERGLRQFFLAHLRSGRNFVSMPSQVVDDLWHEFILYTRSYEAFCHQAFGRFLHHTPAAVLSEHQKTNEGLRRCWYWSCREENIDPRNPSRLPLLFALDVKLGIPDGFVYAPDCKALAPGGSGTAYCGADLGSGTGSDGGCGDASSDSGDGGGCGGD